MTRLSVERIVKEEIINFLQHVGFDCCDRHEDCEVKLWEECDADNENKDDPECCPEHGNCGVCRFEYMKKKGWLSPAVEDR